MMIKKLAIWGCLTVASLSLAVGESVVTGATQARWVQIVQAAYNAGEIDLSAIKITGKHIGAVAGAAFVSDYFNFLYNTVAEQSKPDTVSATDWANAQSASTALIAATPSTAGDARFTAATFTTRNPSTQEWVSQYTGCYSYNCSGANIIANFTEPTISRNVGTDQFVGYTCSSEVDCVTRIDDLLVSEATRLLNAMSVQFAVDRRLAGYVGAEGAVYQGDRGSNPHKSDVAVTDRIRAYSMSMERTAYKPGVLVANAESAGVGAGLAAYVASPSAVADGHTTLADYAPPPPSGNGLPPAQPLGSSDCAEVSSKGIWDWVSVDFLSNISLAVRCLLVPVSLGDSVAFAFEPFQALFVPVECVSLSLPSVFAGGALQPVEVCFPDVPESVLGVLGLLTKAGLVMSSILSFVLGRGGFARARGM